jgi:hypothetical protein
LPASFGRFESGEIIVARAAGRTIEIAPAAALARDAKRISASD